MQVGGAPAREPQQSLTTPGSEEYTNLQRVKVYRLNESGHWDDKGTGHVSCEYMEVRAPSCIGRRHTRSSHRPSGRL